MSGAKANANFHHLSGEDVFQRDDARHIEYRRKWREWPEQCSVGDFPLFIDVEVTSACNLKCPFCATTYRKGLIDKGFIKEETVRSIVDQGADNGLYGVKFNIRGEPLLHPKIHEFVRYAKSKSLIDVYFNTNAVLMDTDMFKKLIDAGLDRLSISFEGITKDVYEKNRVGAVYEEVLINIENAQAIKEKMGVKHPKVRVQTVILPEIERQLDDYKEFWGKRVDEVAFLDYKEMKEKKKGVKHSWICPQIWQRMAIFWDGTLLPCNHDDDALLSFGNVEEVSISEAWNGNQMKKLREAHKTGNAHEYDACDGCYLRMSEIYKNI